MACFECMIQNTSKCNTCFSSQWMVYRSLYVICASTISMVHYILCIGHMNNMQKSLNQKADNSYLSNICALWKQNKEFNIWHMLLLMDNP